MPTDRLSERDFDTILGQALRLSCEAVPADFTGRMLGQVRQLHERKILARVVLQKRLALAGCVGLVAIAVLAPMLLTDSLAGVLQGKAAGFAEQCRTFLDKLPTAIEGSLGCARDACARRPEADRVLGVWGQWQLYTILGAAFGFAAYYLAGLFLGDRSKPLLILDS
jgi:hypothetical protein